VLSVAAHTSNRQAQSIINQQTERYHASQPSSGTPYQSQGFGVNDLRDLAVKYNPSTSPYSLRVQQTIKSAKGVVSAQQTLQRENQTYAKSLFHYSQEQAGPGLEDVQDITDRLAFLEFKQGELHAEYATKLEQARAALKDIRNYEQKLEPNR
jgi:hypothetical protein